MSSTTKSAQQLLDQVNRLAQVHEFDETGYLDQLTTEIVADDDSTSESLEMRDTQIRAALAALDVFATRVMRIRIDHLLAGDTAVPKPFRTYLMTRVLDYDGELDRLRARVQQAVVRIDPDGASDTAAVVVDAADNVLTQRTRLRQGVLALVPDEPEPEQLEESPSPTFFELIELD